MNGYDLHLRRMTAREQRGWARVVRLGLTENLDFDHSTSHRSPSADAGSLPAPPTASNRLCRNTVEAQTIATTCKVAASSNFTQGSDSIPRLGSVLG